MNIFDIFKKKPETVSEHKPKKQTVIKSAKELASDAGQPYVTIVSMDIDPENLHQGSFVLDWNDKFVTNLVRAGYQGKTDADIVDVWFQNVCRHVVMETWEQEQAIHNSGRPASRDVGDGRTEVS